MMFLICKAERDGVEGIHNYLLCRSRWHHTFLSSFKYEVSKLPDLVKYDRTRLTFYIIFIQYVIIMHIYRDYMLYFHVIIRYKMFSGRECGMIWVFQL